MRDFLNALLGLTGHLLILGMGIIGVLAGLSILSGGGSLTDVTDIGLLATAGMVSGAIGYSLLYKGVRPPWPQEEEEEETTPSTETGGDN